MWGRPVDHRVAGVLTQMLAELRTVHVRCCDAEAVPPHAAHVCCECGDRWPCREAEILDRAETALGESGSWGTESPATVTPATTMSALADHLGVDPDRLVMALTAVVRDTKKPVPVESGDDPS